MSDLTASQAADLCAAIYKGPDGFDYYDPGINASGICFGIKKLDGLDVVVLRGSATFLDWRRDFDAFDDPFQHKGLGPVHLGFFRGMPQAWTDIARRVGARVAVTGHSLGAARASILSGLMILDGCVPSARICFGEPAPGFAQLAGELAAIHTSLSFRNGNGVEHDLITRVPYYIPPLWAFVHPTSLIDVSAPPPADDAYGIFGWHHIELYQEAVRNYAVS